MRRVLIAALLISAFACGKGDSGSNVAGPDGPDGPSESDWIDLVGQLASIGTDGLQAAFVSSGAETGFSSGLGLSSPSSRQLKAPPSEVAGTATYFCCGGSSARNITVASVLSAPSASSSPLLQTFANAEVPWDVKSGSTTRTFTLVISDLTIRGTLASQSGNFSGTQQLQLTGTAAYTLPNNQKKTTPLNVSLGYTTYPTGAPKASGQAGPVNATGQQPSTFPPARCTSVPREGCPPCTTGGCGPAPCGQWPACPK